MIVLVVEDNPGQREIIGTALSKAGFTIDAVADGIEALKKIEIRDYDCMIIDLDLPGLSGDVLVEKTRELAITTPILILTANDQITSKVGNLNAGADDYLTKPFSIEELVARVRALERRPENFIPSSLDLGRLQINYNLREVYLNGQPIKLTNNEFRVLEFLARHASRICTRSMLEEHIWGYNKQRESNVIESIIYNLRKKLDKDKSGLIKTIPLAGYQFNTKLAEKL